MNLSDIATLQPDGWWQIDRDATLTGHLILTTERVRVIGSASLEVRDSARFAAPGWAEIASSGWALLRSPDGLYFAGCRMGLTHAQAVAHWGLPRTDERALAYSAALATELT